ncbi:hypothetical protein LPJ53_001143 [Coemansia erecta]|uniref:Uncharacterized protein n=1 Tax=Coemansia erecta TaxID=147472 RepID=A0A9W7Y6B2_9FUNG|nr:hypothetical protein LPJ53_001143 [Coemansia erecta]
MSLGALALFIVGLCRSRSGGDHPGAYYHHSGMSPRTGMFTGFGLCGITITLALSSTVLAGIRRATGLTISRTYPSRHSKKTDGFKAKINARMLAWYDARVEQIEQRAEAHIERIIARHAPEIPDDNVRAVWEQQVRADVMQKVERIKERRDMCPLGGRHGDGERRSTPLLDAYLYMGERLFDWLVDWMRRNPHFVDERDAAALAVEEAEDAMAFNSVTLPVPKPMHRHEPPMNGVAAAAAVRSPQYPPIPYIAVAGPSSAADRASSGSPEPSAPTLSESEFLGYSLKQQTTSLSTPVPSVSVSLLSRSPRIVELQQQLGFDPPPYTPIDELTDAAADLPATSSTHRSRRNPAAAAASKDEVSELKPNAAFN